MKIAVLTNFDKEISPHTTGGSEIFTYLQVTELAKKDTIDHIDVYGVGKNYFRSEKISFISLLPEPLTIYAANSAILSPLLHSRDDFLTELRATLAINLYDYLVKSNYDVIQNNSSSSVITALCASLSTPVVSTLHTNVTSPSILIPYSLKQISKADTMHFISISQYQQQVAKAVTPDLPIIKTIYNAIDTEQFTPVVTTPVQNNALWIGRISKKHNKGIIEALQATEKTDVPITILTSIDDEEYFSSEIKPHITSLVTFVPTTITTAQKANYYSSASFLLYPIMWEEPFGLVFLEALASGTPIIAFARGSVPEIIEDGVTGYIINPSDDDIRGKWIIKETGINGLCEAIKKLRSLPTKEYQQMRKASLARVKIHFSLDQMVSEYQQIYSNFKKPS